MLGVCVDDQVTSVVAGGVIEVTAGDQSEAGLVGVATVEILHGEVVAVGVLPDSVDDEGDFELVVSADDDLVARMQRAEVVEHRRPADGIDVADDDRCSVLAR